MHYVYVTHILKDLIDISQSLCLIRQATCDYKGGNKDSCASKEKSFLKFGISKAHLLYCFWNTAYIMFL